MPDDPKPFDVTVHLTAKDELPANVIESGRELLPVFAQQPGFLGLDFFRSHDGREALVQLRWRTREDHEACRRSADFGAASEAWGAIYGAGKVKTQTFELLEPIAAPT